MKNIKKIIDDSIEELIMDIEMGYSQRIEKYFEWKAKFHKYSFWNTVMILFQRPDATHVKGFQQWKQMGYHVNKGTKAIGIFAPTKTKYIMCDGKKIYWRQMSAAERKKTKDHRTSNYFMGVNVFDIKDTSCTEYPKFFTDLGNNHEEIYETVFDRFWSEVKIVEDNTTSASYFDLVNKNIVLKKQGYYNKLLSLVHELAHFYCDKDIKDYRNLYNYHDGEVHAESIAFIVCKFLGVDNPFSKDYIINWKGSKLKIREHLALIDEVSTTIINRIEGENHATTGKFHEGRKNEDVRRDANILTKV